MRERIGLVVGSVAAIMVLAVGLTAAGFAPIPAPVVDETTPVAGGDVVAEPVTTATQAKPTPRTVYVKPAPKPKTVVVTKPVKATTTTRSTSPVTRVRRTTSVSREGDDDRYERGEREGHEHERGDD